MIKITTIKPNNTQQPVAQQPASKPSGGLVFVFFLVFLVFFPAGVYVAYKNVLQPLAMLNKARTWEETPAKILHLGAKYVSGRRGGSVYIAIRYQYEVNGQIYTSECFNPLNKITNDEYNVQKLCVYKPFFDAGKPITCWVNPVHPAEAVVDRNPIFFSITGSNFIAGFTVLAGLFSLLCIILNFINPGQLINGPMPSYFLVVHAVPTFGYSLFLLIKLLPFLPWPWHTYLIFLPALAFTILCWRRYAKRTAEVIPYNRGITP